MTFILRSPRIDRVTVPDTWGRTGCLVVIPARDEEDRIADCLAALAGQEADALVVANNCTDATSARAARSGAAVIDCTIADGGVGAARRLGVSEGMRRVARVKHLMTSDADCLVAPDWVAANRYHLDAGASAVCGLVRPIPDEHAALPPALLRRAALEDRFLDLKARLEAHLTGKAGHEQTPGASLAFAPDAYTAVGGFHPMPTHEDRTIIQRIKALGLSVVHAREVAVYASCRLEGRAPGGMAAALRTRSLDPDAPLCPDMGTSEVHAVAAVLETLGPLRHQADLPAAIASVERILKNADLLRVLPAPECAERRKPAARQERFPAACVVKTGRSALPTNSEDMMDDITKTQNNSIGGLGAQSDDRKVTSHDVVSPADTDHTHDIGSDLNPIPAAGPDLDDEHDLDVTGSVAEDDGNDDGLSDQDDILPPDTAHPEISDDRDHRIIQDPMMDEDPADDPAEDLYAPIR